MPCSLEDVGETFKALSNEHRLRIMGWLMSPRENFPPHEGGDLVEDGVSVQALTEKTGLTQPSVTNHMHLLQQAGLVRSKRVKNWVLYKAEPGRFREVIDALKTLASRAPDSHRSAA